MKTAKTPKVSKDLRDRIGRAIQSLREDDIAPTTRSIRDRMKTLGGASVSQPLLLEAVRVWRERSRRQVDRVLFDYQNLDKSQQREFRVRARKELA
jgi:hypothetical protein